MFFRALNRWRLCHPVTHVVTLALTLTLILIMVPGQSRYVPDQGRLTWWEQQCEQVVKLTSERLEAERSENNQFLTPTFYHHGWPMSCLARTTAVPAFGAYYEVASKPLLTSGRKISGFLGPSVLADYVSWSNYDNWPFKSVVWRVHWLNLAINLTVFVVAILGVGYGTERWLRSRGGLLRFRLIDLLAAVTACGLVLGWLAHHAQMTKIEQQVIAHGGNNSRTASIRTWKIYSGPDWLVRLVGHYSYLPYFYHVYSAQHLAGRDWREDFNQIVRLPLLQEIRLSLPLPAEAVKQLQACPHLTTLNLGGNMAYAESRLSRYEVVEGTPLFEAENLDELAGFKLRKVRLSERLFLAEDVERLLAATSLEKLHLHSVSLSEEEIESLKQRYPQTEISTSWGMRAGPPASDDQTTLRVREQRKQKDHHRAAK